MATHTPEIGDIYQRPEAWRHELAMLVERTDRTYPTWQYVLYYPQAEKGTQNLHAISERMIVNLWQWTGRNIHNEPHSET